jgi:hypothetical protein
MTLWRSCKARLAEDVFGYVNADVVVRTTVGEVGLPSSIRGQYRSRARAVGILCQKFVRVFFSFSYSQSLESCVCVSRLGGAVE